MKPYKTLIAAPALAAVLAACAITPTLEEQEAAYLAMTQEAFASGLTVIDDPLNPSVEINTQGGGVRQTRTSLRFSRHSRC